MAYTRQEYKQLLKSLLPKGKAISRSVNALIDDYFNALAEEFVRVDDRQDDLIEERQVLYTDELIDEHEADYNITDPATNLSDRRTTLYGKLTARGGQFKEYFESVADSMGYEITIEEFQPFFVGMSTMGATVGDLWLLFLWYVWVQVDGNRGAFTYDFAWEEFDGLNPNDTSWYIGITRGFDDLIAEFFRIRPAHTRVLFDFYGIEFNRAFSNAYNSIPTNDDSVPCYEFDFAFSTGFTALHEYDGTYLTGAYYPGFSLAFDRKTGGAFSWDFGNGLGEFSTAYNFDFNNHFNGDMSSEYDRPS